MFMQANDLHKAHKYISHIHKYYTNLTHTHTQCLYPQYVPKPHALSAPNTNTNMINIKCSTYHYTLYSYILQVHKYSHEHVYTDVRGYLFLQHLQTKSHACTFLNTENLPILKNPKIIILQGTCTVHNAVHLDTQTQSSTSEQSVCTTPDLTICSRPISFPLYKCPLSSLHATMTGSSILQDNKNNTLMNNTASNGDQQ